MRSVVTQRLVLRSWARSDRETWSRLATDPDLTLHIGDGRPLEAELIARRFDEVLGAADDSRLFAIEKLDEPGPAIGMVGFSPPAFLPELLPVQEIGWRLLASAWGNGFATEAAEAALTWAFEGELFERVVSCIQPANRRSIAVAGRLGMKPLHRTVLPRSERWIDVYEATAEDWNS